MADTPAEFFGNMEKNVNREKTKDMNATYQWVITGDSGGKWYAKFTNGDVSVKQGEAESPNITITVADSDWMDIVNGKLNGQMAFFSGKLKIQGDMALAMKLQSLTG